MSCAGYSYPVPNSRLLSLYNLERHSEGGFYAVTHVSPHLFPISAVTKEHDKAAEITIAVAPNATDDARRLATTIYYLLSPASPRGYLHLNKATTMHLHHAGRARYTLIKPSEKGPVIRHVVMGENTEDGEVRQLLVEGGWWKASEIPPEDLARLDEDESQRLQSEERIGCLISEVVFPGFEWEDHAFITKSELKQLFANAASPDAWKDFSTYVRPDAQH